MEIKRIRTSSGSDLLICFGIKGLVSEGEAIKNFLHEELPDRIIMDISPEEVEGLTKFLDDPFEVPLGDYDVIYGTILARFGEVETPPPIYVQPVIYGKKREVEMVGIDMDEDTFSEKYDEEFKFRHFIKFITVRRRLMHHSFDLSSPEAFVVEWRKEVNRNSALRNMDIAREEEIGRRLRDIIENREEKARKMVAIVAYEFRDRVLEIIGKNETTNENLSL
ncbi:hypothetical protein [Caldiplasma sukawensis]